MTVARALGRIAAAAEARVVVTTCRHESSGRRHVYLALPTHDGKRLHRPRLRSGIAARPCGTIVALTDQGTTTMLRIRTHVQIRRNAARLEGRLAGPWVDELARMLGEAARRDEHAAPIHVDLDGVTFVSAAGKALLARLHDDGAVLTARGCMTSAIIDEIAMPRPARPEESERGAMMPTWTTNHERMAEIRSPDRDRRRGARIERLSDADTRAAPPIARSSSSPRSPSATCRSTRRRSGRRRDSSMRRCGPACRATSFGRRTVTALR